MERKWLLEEALTRSVIGAFFEVYNTLGFGFLEHVYGVALERERAASPPPAVQVFAPSARSVLAFSSSASIVSRIRLDQLGYRSCHTPGMLTGADS